MKTQTNTYTGNQNTIFGNTLRILVMSVLVLVFSGKAKSQDKLMLVNGTEMIVKVIGTSETEIRYKSQFNLTGPTYVISRADIFMIQYENGEKLVFRSDVGKQPIPLPVDTDVFVPRPNKTFGGPRFGFTYITTGTLASELTREGKNPLITQFGWQFETRLFTTENGASGIVEFIPLIGGMEQGVFLPSANLLIGIRGGGKQSLEFAVGPNLSVAGLGMVFAAGTNFRSGNINFPVNIAFVPSVGRLKTTYDSNGNSSSTKVHTGFRISLTVGFNVRRK